MYACMYVCMYVFNMFHDLLLHEHRDVINWSRDGARQVHSGVASVNVRQDALDEACVAHLHTDTQTQTQTQTQIQTRCRR